MQEQNTISTRLKYMYKSITTGLISVKTRDFLISCTTLEKMGMHIRPQLMINILQDRQQQMQLQSPDLLQSFRSFHRLSSPTTKLTAMTRCGIRRYRNLLVSSLVTWLGQNSSRQARRQSRAVQMGDRMLMQAQMARKLQAFRPIRVVQARKYTVQMMIVERAVMVGVLFWKQKCDSSLKTDSSCSAGFLALRWARSKKESRLRLPPAIVRGYVNISTYFSVMQSEGFTQP